jgi:hypothetical protein
MKYAIAIVSTLLSVSCSNGTSPPTHESSASSSNDAATRWTNDWHLEMKHDVISETDTAHLVNELSPTGGDDKTKIRIDLTCPAPGIFDAEISVDPAIYVWQKTIQDVLGKKLLGAAGIPSDSVSTLVQWRAGKTIRKAYIPQGKYNNVVNIPKFLGFSEDEWVAPDKGSLAVSVETDHGNLGAETELVTPTSLKFLKQCGANWEKSKAEAAKKESDAKAVARTAALAAKERGVLEEKGKATFSGVVDKFWPKCGEYHVMKALTGDRAIRQVRTLQIWFKENQPLTAEDRRNGYSWKGRFEASFIEHREFRLEAVPDPITGSKIQWDDWERWPTGTGCGEIEGDAWLQNGNWDAEVHDSLKCPVQHVSCSVIP